MKSESGRVRGDITNMLGGKPPRTSGINSSTTMCRRRGGGGGREEWGKGMGKGEGRDMWFTRGVQRKCGRSIRGRRDV